MDDVKNIRVYDIVDGELVEVDNPGAYFVWGPDGRPILRWHTDEEMAQVDAAERGEGWAY